MVKQLILCLALLCSPAWAAFRSAGAATSAAIASTSFTPASPAGLAANDIIICVLSLDAGSSTGTFATGFTVLFNDTISAPDGQTVKVAWKRAVGGDTLTITALSNSVSKLAQCFAWSGRDTGNPPVGSASAVNTSSNASPTTVTANGVTALSGDDLFWIGALDTSIASSSNTLTQPAGYTSQGASNDTIDHFDTFGTATKDNVSAGATGTVPGSLTHSGTAGWASYVIRIPSSGGGGGACTPTLTLMGVGSCG